VALRINALPGLDQLTGTAVSNVSPVAPFREFNSANGVANFRKVFIELKHCYGAVGSQSLQIRPRKWKKNFHCFVSIAGG
jgi:hypothetical protein